MFPPSQQLHLTAQVTVFSDVLAQRIQPRESITILMYSFGIYELTHRKALIVTQMDFPSKDKFSECRSPLEATTPMRRRR